MAIKSLPLPHPDRVLLVSLGSIGVRHLRNLRRLCPDTRIAVLRRPGADADEARAAGADEVLHSLQAALTFAPDAGIVASPAPFHVEAAEALARVGVPLLIEKPLSDGPATAAALVRLCRENSVTLAVGYNLRFLPSLGAAREQIAQGAIGEVFSVRAEVGQYLPDWRRGTDYRQGVTANAKLGGGVLLELSHEIDYLLWMFGMPARVTAVGGRSGQLEVDDEDIVELTIQNERPWRLVSVHLDMLQRRPYRRCRLVGTQGSVEWDGLADTVRLDNLQEGAPRMLQGVTLTDKNDMYLDELRDFLAAAAAGNAPACTGEDGLHTLAVIEAARHSIAEGGRAVEPSPEYLS
jgi:predicted dehydrogenase